MRTFCPSVGPVTSSATTVNAGTPEGILGWSQHTFGGGAFSGQASDIRARAATVTIAWRGIRDLLEGKPQTTPDRRSPWPEMIREKGSRPFPAPPGWASVRRNSGGLVGTVPERAP